MVVTESNKKSISQLKAAMDVFKADPQYIYIATVDFIRNWKNDPKLAFTKEDGTIDKKKIDQELLDIQKTYSFRSDEAKLIGEAIRANIPDSLERVGGRSQSSEAIKASLASAVSSFSVSSFFGKKKDTGQQR